MGDRTYYRLSLPPTLAAAVIATTAAVFTEDAWGLTDAQRLLGHRYSEDSPLHIDVPERSVGRCREDAESVREALTAAGHDVPFTVTEDPCYEWLGTMVRYQPGKGMHEVDCDATGRAVITDTQLQHLIREHPNPQAALDQITAYLGLDWQEQELD